MGNALTYVYDAFYVGGKILDIFYENNIKSHIMKFGKKVVDVYTTDKCFTRLLISI